MTLFHVGVRRNLTETTVVPVEASSEEEAIRIVGKGDDDRPNDSLIFRDAEWDLETVEYEGVYAVDLEKSSQPLFSVSVERIVHDVATIIVPAKSAEEATAIIEAAENPDSEHRHYLVDADWELNDENYTVTEAFPN